MLKEQRGKEIDRYDCVIRQKRCQGTLAYPHQYGTKTDVVCGSWTIAPELLKIPAYEYWAFLDSRHEGVADAEIERVRGTFTVRRDLCDEWNARYRQLRTPYERWVQTVAKKTSDNLGHTHMSAGLHTLLYACDILNPKSVTLMGFDSVKAGCFHWSVTRGPEYDQYPDHRWDVERDMVPIIAEEFGTEVQYA